MTILQGYPLRAGRTRLQLACSSNTGPQKRLLHCMRHGTTEMNEYLRRVPYGSFGFQDPLLYDTRLTKEGLVGAKKATQIAKNIQPQPEVLVVSPLSRAIQTAQIAWEHYDGPVLVEALVRERVWLSSDVGRPPAELLKEFETFPGGQLLDFSHLNHTWWWSAQPSDVRHVSLEPEGVFKARVDDLRQWLLGRPERIIGIVAHWGLLRELTGEDYENCQIRSYELLDGGELLPITVPVEMNIEMSA